jgi:hypothetical protein
MVNYRVELNIGFPKQYHIKELEKGICNEKSNAE